MENKQLKIELGTPADINELERLYNYLNNYLSATVNHPRWIKGIYPILENAIAGIKANTLFVVRSSEKILGSVIVYHQPKKAYKGVNWRAKADYEQIYRTIVKFFHKPLESMQVPVLLTGSMRDEFITSDFFETTYAKLLAKISNGVMRLFEQGGHPVMLSNAEAFAKTATEFLIKQK